MPARQPAGATDLPEGATALPPVASAPLEARIISLIGVAQDCAAACQDASRQLRAALEANGHVSAEQRQQLDALRSGLEAMAVAVQVKAQRDPGAEGAQARPEIDYARVEAACSALERAHMTAVQRDWQANWVERLLFTLLGVSLGAAALLWGFKAQLDRIEGGVAKASQTHGRGPTQPAALKPR